MCSKDVEFCSWSCCLLFKTLFFCWVLGGICNWTRHLAQSLLAVCFHPLVRRSSPTWHSLNLWSELWYNERLSNNSEAGNEYKMGDVCFAAVFTLLERHIYHLAVAAVGKWEGSVFLMSAIVEKDDLTVFNSEKLCSVDFKHPKVFWTQGTPKIMSTADEYSWGNENIMSIYDMTLNHPLYIAEVVSFSQDSFCWW